MNYWFLINMAPSVVPFFLKLSIAHKKYFVESFNTVFNPFVDIVDFCALIEAYIAYSSTFPSNILEFKYEMVPDYCIAWRSR